NRSRPSSGELFRFREVPHLGKAPCCAIALGVSNDRVAESPRGAVISTPTVFGTPGGTK
ncbi:hypothetical protein KI387_018276, partial [Taxus chinensis]